MSRFKLSLMLVMLAAFSMPAMAGDKVVKRVPAGAVAFHFVWDLDLVPDEPGPPEFVGYIAFIEGVDGSFFDVPADPAVLPTSKDTAFFTVRVTEPLPPPNFLPVPDTNLVALVYPPGAQFKIFYNSSPFSRDWSNPQDFEQGVPIAVFEESALLNSGAASASFNTFSSRLIDSTPIKFNGQKIDFKKLVPNGVTITNFGNGFRPPDFVGASGGGTAIAIGGKLRGASDDD